MAALETRIAPSLGVMTRHKWELVEELSEDTSQYMLDIVSAARETMPQASSRELPRSFREPPRSPAISLAARRGADAAVRPFLLRQVRRVVPTATYCRALPMPQARGLALAEGRPSRAVNGVDPRRLAPFEPAASSLRRHPR